MSNIKVSLREKSIKNGRKSLYLDFYPALVHPITQKSTRREFLKLYLYGNPKNAEERTHNRNILHQADTIRAKRVVAVENNDYGFMFGDNGHTDFLVYFKELADTRKDNRNNYGNWHSTYLYLKVFTNGAMPINRVDVKFVKGFKNFLMTTTVLNCASKKLSQNSQYAYFNKFRAALREAFNDSLLSENPARKVKSIAAADTQREFLTFEELKVLAHTDCELPILKRAALFSALTGLRWSDIEKLKWSDIQYSEHMNHYIRLVEKKTKNVHTLNIPNQALELLGERGEPNQLVFEGLKYNAHNNLKLARWVLNAGITKKITFHCFRHTFATLQLSLGTNMPTIQKLLGHKDIRTTQLYAKVIDKSKREAVERIPDLGL